MNLRMEELNIGPVPYEENCAQVGQDHFERDSLIECSVFRDMLTRIFPPPPGCRFKIARFPHDFGMYREVVAQYPIRSAKGADWAFRAEGECPGEWDQPALDTLAEIRPLHESEDGHEE